MVEINAFRIFALVTLSCVLYLSNRGPLQLGKDRARRAPTTSDLVTTWNSLPASCLAAGQMALTFDDGPGNPNTASLLTELAAASVTGTYHCDTGFLTDSTVVALLKRIFAAGHLIGIKLNPLVNATTWSPASVVSQLQMQAALVHQSIAVYPKFVRIPYQTVPKDVLTAVQAAGFVVTGWAIDSMDYTYQYASDTNVTAIGQNIAARYKGAAATAPESHPIVLFRSNLQINAYTMTNTLQILQAAITTPLVTLDVCLNTDKYRAVNCPAGGCSATSSTAVNAGGTPVAGGAGAGAASGGGGGAAGAGNVGATGAAGTGTGATTAKPTTSSLGDTRAVSGTSMTAQASWTLLSMGIVAAFFVCCFKPFSVVIVGGGLVGSLQAIFCAKRGWKVDVYEARHDPRNDKTVSGRSINLALSVRGISALKAAGVEKHILENMIPMKGRLIHSKDGRLSSQPYGIFGECINSVDRMAMNKHLLDSAEKFSNVTLHFNHELLQCDFDSSHATFKRKDGTNVSVKASLVIGADGVHSRARQQLMRKARIDFSQKYIDHAWVELTIPPTANGEYAMDAHHLHIWPRQTFMMIALPNLDKSFTVTLFMPQSKFDAITTEGDLKTFFRDTFPDSIPHMGEKLLVQEYFKNTKGSLAQIKCRPYHYQDKAVIIGDAAHAMVPFYGQGMNCGMEDCLVLEENLTTHLGLAGSPSSTNPDPARVSAALDAYSAQRNPDVEAMCDLAMYNYVEMRSSVTKAGYLFRKTVEGWLHRLFPTAVIPLYTMVSFSRIPYSEALRRWQRQSAWFDTASLLGKVAVVTSVSAAVFALVVGKPVVTFRK
ncbi:hypothetical protein HDU89_005372 [Geranomyces variabilis]|nr:hypothetical protein HDU89_005372 [Geranomyces variabilis]